MSASQFARKHASGSALDDANKGWWIFSTRGSRNKMSSWQHDFARFLLSSDRVRNSKPGAAPPHQPATLETSGQHTLASSRLEHIIFMVQLVSALWFNCHTVVQAGLNIVMVHKMSCACCLLTFSLFHSCVCEARVTPGRASG